MKKMLSKFFFITIAGMGCLSLSASAKIADRHAQNMATILEVVGQSFDVNVSRLIDTQEVDRADLQKTIARELPGIKTKLAGNVDQLTQEQRDILTNALRKWKEMSAFTRDELLIIGQTALNESEAFDKEFKKHFPEKPVIANNEDRISFINKLRDVDLGSLEFNLLKRFMCCAGDINFDDTLKPLNELESNRLLLDQLAGDKQALFTLKACNQAIKSAALVFVVVHDHYFVPSWQQEFEKAGDVFSIVHKMCTELLAAVE